MISKAVDRLEQKFQQFWNLLTKPELMIPILHIFMTKNILVTKGGTLWNFRMMGSQGQYKDLSYGLETLHGNSYGVLEWENLQSPIQLILFYILNHPTLNAVTGGLELTRRRSKFKLLEQEHIQ